MKQRPLRLTALILLGSVLTLTAFNATQAGNSGASSPPSASSAAAPVRGRTTLTGTVEQVWEDGFRLNTDGRTVVVDAWDVFGDNTRANVRVGARVSVSGEMSGGEFDAASITPMAR